MGQELNVAVIGGGYAGMAAAVTLAERGILVTVFESAQQLGGRARGVLHNDTMLDNGQHLLLGCYHQTLRMIEQVGGDIEKDFLRLPLQLELHRQFSLKAPRLPAPLHLLVALLTAQSLSFSSRLNAARFMLALRRANFRLNKLPDGTTSHSTKPASVQVAGYLPQAGEGWGRDGEFAEYALRPSSGSGLPAGTRTASEGASDMTVTELLARHVQDADLTQKLWEPLCIAALNTPIQKASAQVLLNVLRDALNRSRSDSDMLLPRINFTALFPQRAANYIEQHGGKVYLSCGVEALHPLEGGFEIITKTSLEPSSVRPELVEGTNGAQNDPVEGRASVHVSTSSTRTENEAAPQNSYRFSRVICATSPAVATKLLRPISGLESVVTQIESLQHQPIYTVYLQYPAHVTLPHPMLGLHQRYSQWLFDKGRISGQHGLLAAVISAEGMHQELSQEELAQKVIAELSAEFGIVEPPEWFKVIAEKRATFCCSPNLLRPSQLTPLPRLLLAGDYTAGDYPATLEGAVMSGLKCADMIDV